MFLTKYLQVLPLFDFLGELQQSLCVRKFRNFMVVKFCGTHHIGSLDSHTPDDVAKRNTAGGY